MRSSYKTAIFWVAFLCAVVIVWRAFGIRKQQPAISFTEFIRHVEADRVSKVSIREGREVRGEYNNGGELRTLIPRNYVVIYSILRDHQVDIRIEEEGNGWVNVLINASPFILLLAFWLFMMRQMKAGAAGGLSINC